MQMYRLSVMHMQGHVSAQHSAVYYNGAPTDKLMQRYLIGTSQMRWEYLIHAIAIL